ncbi:hypothetical protein PLUTE_b0179 [Pseudoalteromonas luteoviolacea DSM 6061]|nr:hypothetical protein [Pseudoalteromonas luteoviolacea DSM 6061]
MVIFINLKLLVFATSTLHWHRFKINTYLLPLAFYLLLTRCELSNRNKK